MKIYVMMFMSLLLFSFSVQEIDDEIADALKVVKTEEIIKFFSEKTSLKVLNQEDFVSKSKAQAIIEDFFAKLKVKGYQASHTSLANFNQQFITGKLDTIIGKFRISILVRGNLISQFRIENE
ncbi:MAG: DUF4783 domain-containing protein [Bacteroidota bacterium]